MPGTYRSGRRPKMVVPVDAPKRPKKLKGVGKVFWERVIDPAQHLGLEDSDMCGVAVDMLEMYHASLAVAKANPVDRDARISVTNYAEKFLRVMAQLNLDPLGRARAQTNRDDDDEDPLTEFLT